jgi:hypothetical protein
MALSLGESHMKPELREQLNTLHQELSVLRSLDTESRQLLLVLLSDISRLLDPNAPSDPEDSPVERLESLAAKFDADHPALSGAVRQLMDALAKAGI